MSRRHGRAVMPFGKYRGARVSMVPDHYLFWLVGSEILVQPKFGWLMESVLAELRHRGFNTDEVHSDLISDRQEIEAQQKPIPPPFERDKKFERAKRAIRFA